MNHGPRGDKRQAVCCDSPFSSCCGLFCFKRFCHGFQLDLQWRAGVPLRVVFQSRLASRKLRSALAAVPLGDVELPDSLMKLHRRTLSAVVSALATSAATLTALRALPLQAALRDRPQLGLAALTELRALRLYQADDAPEGLQATRLPTSLQKLKLICFDPMDDGWDEPMLPALVDFDRLHNLRRISLSQYERWRLSSRDHETGQLCALQVPHSLEARPLQRMRVIASLAPCPLMLR